ncbi:hypothetical protein [Acinetobacter colistiniresistens]|uniref:hypothetical protein n=1 Tax=Acinetobacter colistiniresistens TaxID=280145 RepID=UPI0012505317|nr:hypothetical protein [Acinetobacter colistiniresistens]
MNDLFNNSWFVGIVTGLIVLAIPKLFNFIKYHLGKRGVIGKFFRKSNLKTLKRIRLIRNNETKVTHELIKKYCYLTIFLLGIMIYFWLIISLSILSSDFRSYINQKTLMYNVSTITIGLPIFIFEILYLNQKDFVEKLFKFIK